VNEKKLTTIYQTMNLLNAIVMENPPADLKEQALRLHDELAEIYASPDD
jgi:hypothetical protein